MSEEALLTIDAVEDVDRLDKILKRKFPQFSRTYFQQLIEKGCVLINGSLWKKKDKLSLGDEIEICFELSSPMEVHPQDIPLDILYEDAFLLAINKPVGMVVHPAPGHYQNTFANALLHHCLTKGNPLEATDPVRPGIVHRLDKDTSGLLLGAKTIATHQALVASFAQRNIHKTYLAICRGNPQERSIHLPLARCKKNRQQMCVDKEGKEAITEVKTLYTEKDFSLVELRPLTGRTHQLRVHLASIGCPILGDPVYGRKKINQEFGIETQMLHAYKLSFLHPITQHPLELKAALSSFMQHYLKRLFLKLPDIF